jgi:hypothetical protein
LRIAGMELTKISARTSSGRAEARRFNRKSFAIPQLLSSSAPQRTFQLRYDSGVIFTKE